MNDIKRSHVGKRLSEVAEYNGVLYLAGQIAEKLPASMREQTEEVLGHIDRLLAEHGSDKTRILQCQIYISDMSQFAEMNAAWDAWVPQGHTPPRATVEAKLASPDKLVEIVVTAAAGARSPS